MQATTGISEFSAGLASQFNRLNRAILVADKPQSWQPAIEAMTLSFRNWKPGWWKILP